MLRFIFRALGFVLRAAAFAGGVVDGRRSIAGGRPLFTSLGDGAAAIGGVRYGAALAVAAGWPWPAQRIVAGLLAVPGALAAVALGLGLLHAGRPADGAFSERRT